jgi:hypothetical protein
MGLVPPRMLGSRLTWIIVGGLVALLIVGAVDALRGSPPKREATLYVPLAPNSTAATTTAPAPRCLTNQLDPRMEPVGSDLALVLAHTEGQPCRTPRLRIDVTLLDGSGQPAKATASIQEFFAPTDDSRTSRWWLASPFSIRVERPSPSASWPGSAPITTTAVSRATRLSASMTLALRIVVGRPCGRAAAG